MLKTLTDAYNSPSKNETIQLLTRNFLGEIISQLNQSENNISKAAFIDQFLENIRPKDPSKVLQSKFPGNLISDINSLMVEKLGQQEEFLQARGIDYGKLLNHSTSIYDTTRSILSILGLEHIRPGISARLQSNYGINNFFRYSSEFLLALDNNGENIDLKKRVLVIVAAYDRNGAFDSQSLYKELLNLRKHGIEPLLFEVDSLEDLQSIVDHTDNRILESVFQVMFSGHGEYSNIQLGGADSDEIREDNITQLVDIFQKLPNVRDIILDSCSTGKTPPKGGSLHNIKDIIGNALKIHVIAPRIDAGNLSKMTKDGIEYIPHIPIKNRFHLPFGKSFVSEYLP